MGWGAHGQSGRRAGGQTGGQAGQRGWPRRHAGLSGRGAGLHHHVERDRDVLKAQI